MTALAAALVVAAIVAIRRWAEPALCRWEARRPDAAKGVRPGKGKVGPHFPRGRRGRERRARQPLASGQPDRGGPTETDAPPRSTLPGARGRDA